MKITYRDEKQLRALKCLLHANRVDYDGLIARVNTLIAPYTSLPIVHPAELDHWLQVHGIEVRP